MPSPGSHSSSSTKQTRSWLQVAQGTQICQCSRLCYKSLSNKKFNMKKDSTQFSVIVKPAFWRRSWIALLNSQSLFKLIPGLPTGRYHVPGVTNTPVLLCCPLAAIFTQSSIMRFTKRSIYSCNVPCSCLPHLISMITSSP